MASIFEALRDRVAQEIDSTGGLPPASSLMALEAREKWETFAQTPNEETLYEFLVYVKRHNKDACEKIVGALRLLVALHEEDEETIKMLEEGIRRYEEGYR